MIEHRKNWAGSQKTFRISRTPRLQHRTAAAAEIVENRGNPAVFPRFCHLATWHFSTPPPPDFLERRPLASDRGDSSFAPRFAQESGIAASRLGESGRWNSRSQLAPGASGEWPAFALCFAPALPRNAQDRYSWKPSRVDLDPVARRPGLHQGGRHPRASALRLAPPPPHQHPGFAGR